MFRKRTKGSRSQRMPHSIKGIYATVCGAISMIATIVLVCISFSMKGKGSLYIGTVGFLAMIFSVTGFIMALSSFKERKVRKVYSVIGVILNIVMIVIYALIYVFMLLI